MIVARVGHIALLAGIFAVPVVGGAQGTTTSTRRVELRLPSGGYIATGVQRAALKDAQASAAQLSLLVSPRVALTGTFTWARSRDLALPDTPKLDVFTSDLGVEVRTAKAARGESMTFAGFIGSGAGVRSYNHRSLTIDATNNLAAYASVGGTLTVRRVEVRLEARDYASGFRPLIGGGKSGVRNDVVIMGALRIVRRAEREQP